jgi:hypothetical protein
MHDSEPGNSVRTSGTNGATAIVNSWGATTQPWRSVVVTARGILPAEASRGDTSYRII